MRVSVVTQGCKVNQADSGALEEELEARGHELVPFGREADAVVINTCTVTHRSDRDARALIRRARRTNPGARVVVTGCLAQVDPEALRALGAHAVVGVGGKGAVPDVVEGACEGAAAVREGPLPPVALRRLRGRSRALLKVQEGCDAYCAYCIVPHARGAPRSLGLDDVRSGLAALRGGGHSEVVLTGVHLGLWGRDLAPPRPFAALLDAAEGAGLARVRLSSLEPREVTPDVVERLASSRVLCPHLHIPLQSGSDRVLRAMGRPYGVAEFCDVVARAHESVDGICLGFDLIVGFPGEDDAAFRETLSLLEGLPFAYLHVFPFSPRRGTRAWDLEGRIPEGVIRERASALRVLSGEKRLHFWRRHLGATMPALAEGGAEGGRLRLTTRNYIPVTVAWQGPAPEGEILVRLVGPAGEGVEGLAVVGES